MLLNEDSYYDEEDEDKLGVVQDYDDDDGENDITMKMEQKA